MRHELRQLIERAKTIGYRHDGWDSRGHARLVHTNGQSVSLAATPSDWRSRLNEISRLERVAGAKLPRQRAGRYSHKRGAHERLAPASPHSMQVCAEIDDLLAESDDLARQWDGLTAGSEADRTLIDCARKILVRYEEVRRELASRNRLIDPITAVRTEH